MQHHETWNHALARQVDRRRTGGHGHTSRVADLRDVAVLDDDRLICASGSAGTVDDAHVGQCHDRRIDGYEANKCLLARDAAQALARVQAEVRAYGLSLKTYDCYRPRRAVADFAAWARVVQDTKMKAEFYPDIDKSRLFELGYIAERSGHSRGSTVDLTLVKLPAKTQPPIATSSMFDSVTLSRIGRPSTSP